MERFSRTLPASAPPVQRGIRPRTAIIVAVVIIVLAVAGIEYIFVTGEGPFFRPPNLLANGGFHSGDLQGWQSVPPYLPAVESSVVARGSSYAARFQTPTNNASVSGPCLTLGTRCGLLNVSTIYQTIGNLTVAGNSRFSLAVNPSFQYPSAFQVTLEFGLSPSAANRTGYSDVFVYYLVLASSQQCSTYSGYLLSSVPAGATAAAHCLSAPQGAWTSFSRGLVSDLPSGISRPDLARSTMTISVSFAGAGPTDEIYVDALYLS